MCNKVYCHFIYTLLFHSCWSYFVCHFLLLLFVVVFASIHNAFSIQRFCFFPYVIKDKTNRKKIEKRRKQNWSTWDYKNEKIIRKKATKQQQKNITSVWNDHERMRCHTQFWAGIFRFILVSVFSDNKIGK